MRYATPTPAFPYPPAVSIEVPDGWVPRPDAAGLMAFGGPVDSGFQANVVVTAARIGRGLDLTAVAGLTRQASAASHADFEVVAEGNGVIGGRPALLRAVTFAVGGGRRLYQAQVLLLHTEPAEASANHLIRFEGTCTVDQAESLTTPFREMALTLTIGVPGARGAASAQPSPPSPPEPPALPADAPQPAQDTEALQARRWLIHAVQAEVQGLVDQRDQTLLANSPDLTSRNPRKALVRYNALAEKVQRQFESEIQVRDQLLRSLSTLQAEEVLRLARAKGWKP